MDNIICDKSQAKAIKQLLKLYRKVLHSVNNELVYLDSEIYVNSRRHLTDFIDSIAEFPTQKEKDSFNSRIQGHQGSLALLEMLDKTLAMVKNYPDNGNIYYNILYGYYFDYFKYTHTELCEVLDMTESSYYRYFDQAISCYYVHFISVVKARGFEFNSEAV